VLDEGHVAPALRQTQHGAERAGVRVLVGAVVLADLALAEGARRRGVVARGVELGGEGVGRAHAAKEVGRRLHVVVAVHDAQHPLLQQRRDRYVPAHGHAHAAVA